MDRIYTVQDIDSVALSTEIYSTSAAKHLFFLLYHIVYMVSCDSADKF